jgi:hypothetical protein
MTNNQPNESYQSFHVQSDLLKNAARQTDQQPQSSGGSGKPGNSGPKGPFDNWDISDARWLLMPVFAAIYWVTERDPRLQPMAIIVLLVCLLFRMEPRARQLAGVPLVLAAIKLVFQMTQNSSVVPQTLGMMPEQTKVALSGMPWVPMFLAICIFYLPKMATVTGTITRVGAMSVLVSGLIPGDAYLVVLAMIQYTLFVGVVVGLIADRTWNGEASERNGAMRSARS